MGCNCNERRYSVSMGCCEPVLAPIENYYTKYQIDKMIEEIESGITSGCCITPEEVESAITSAITYVESEIPSLSGYATEQWVLDKHYISGVDLSDYALKSEIPTVPTSNTAFTNDAGYITDVACGYDSEAQDPAFVVGYEKDGEYVFGDYSELFRVGEGLKVTAEGALLENHRLSVNTTSAVTSGSTQIPTSDAVYNWVINQGYLTEHQPIKTINGQSLIGTGDIEIGTGGTIDLSNYYTTAQTINLVESAVTVVEGEIPTVPTSNTAFTNDAGYLTEHQSLSGYATEQWVEEKHYLTRVDLSDYVTYDSLPDLSTYATKTWVTNQNYVVNSELIQYITNLQEQIDSLRAEISGCCGSTGETITRWITMTGASDYTCSGTTKMTKEKQQQSTDGGNTWSDTGNYRTGSTVLEVNSVDCGYIPPIPTNYKYKFTLDDSSIISEECDSTSSITTTDTSEYKSRLVSAEIGDCITSIDKSSFYYATGLTSVIIPDSVEVIDDYAFNGCSGITSCTIGSGVTRIGKATFEYCHGLTNVILPDSLTTIDCYAFYECSGLTNVTIGSGITSIVDYAFTDCRNLQSITINATTPPSLATSETKSYAFDGTNNCPIYVPAQSVDAYRTTPRWIRYSARIQAIQ